MGASLVRREIRHRPGRTSLLVVAVTVAVAFTTAAFGFAEQLSIQLDAEDTDLGSLSFPEGTVVVSPRTTGITTATSLDENLLAEIRSVPGVLAANGILDQPVSFSVRAREQPERPVQLRGLVLSAIWDPQRWDVLEGRAPTETDEVAVDPGGALVGRAPLGSTVRLQLPTGTRRVSVVGLVAPATGATAPTVDTQDLPGSVAEVAIASAHVVLPAAHAADLLGTAGKVDRVSVLPAPGVDPADLADQLTQTLPPGVEVLTLTDRSQATQSTVAGLDNGVRTGVTVFAVLTVLVAALAVSNIYTVVVAQRTRELALLRLVGATRAQLARIVVSEALVVGVIGAAMGLVAGSLLAWLAVDVVNPVGVRASATIVPSMVVAALAVGVLVTLIGAAAPAVRAARAVPLDAVSDTGAGADRSAPWWIGAVLTVGGLAVAGLALATSATVLGSGLGPTWLVAAGVGLLTGLLGLAMLSRWLVVPLAALATPPAVALGGVPARLGLGNVRRRPSRTAAGASTLMITLALVGLVSTAGAGARDNVESTFANTGRADLFLERRGLVRVDTGSLFARLEEVLPVVADGAEVVAVEGVLIGPGGQEDRVTTSGLGRVARMIDLDVVDGDPDAGVDSEAQRSGEGMDDGVMLSESTADRLGLAVGDPATLRSTSGRETRVEVVATYRNTAFVGPAVVAWPAVDAVDAEGTFELAALEISSEVPLAAAYRATRNVADRFPKLRVHTPEEFAALDGTVATTVLRVVGVLLAGSVGIGFLGLGSTLALATHERRRELVMLRAVGASRAQIRSLVGIEAATIGAMAAVLGLGAGAALGWAASELSPAELVTRTVVPVAGLAAVAAAAVVVSWLVSLGSARRAGRVPPADAGRDL